MKKYYIVTEKKAKTLQEIDLTQRPTEYCNDFHENFVWDDGDKFFSDGVICAGGKKNRDGCKGDSGSALMVTDKMHRRVVQVGVMSGAPYQGDCGSEHVPSYYTKVTYYLKWILDNIYE